MFSIFILINSIQSFCCLSILFFNVYIVLYIFFISVLVILVDQWKWETFPCQLATI